ncbi:MAG: outer membrane beta-barrel protein [Saprospiraceae bacterium]|nr:outer membrane beta-barrel protein [Saprospiraceae bacterium]
MKNIIRILAILALPFASQAQHLEAGILLGGANYVGDLSNNSSNLYLKETKFAAGLFVKQNLNDLFAVRLGFNWARISGQDANVRNDDFVHDRNLSFRTTLMEFGLTGEWNILGYQPYGLSRPFSPYLFLGVAGTKYTPKARYQGNWENLQSLGTEGQGMDGLDDPYKTFAFAIPFGVGVKYALTDRINLGLEFGARPTFTDYLDDVSGNYVSYPELLAGNGQLAAALGNRTGELTGSEPVVVATGTQRGDSAKKDWYFIMGVTVSYNFLDNGLMGSRKRGGRRAGCYN